MSDLISRSELLKAFNNKKIQITFDLPVEDVFAKLVQDAVQANNKMVIDTIKNQPTAYSVDKVVEELELHSFELGTDSLPVHYVRLNEAIEIVKQGGVSEEVCEWKQTSTARYKTSCGYKLEAHFDTNACYCRQCGKKIKVVE